MSAKSEKYMQQKWGEPKPTPEQMLEIILSEIRALREEVDALAKRPSYTMTYALGREINGG